MRAHADAHTGPLLACMCYFTFHSFGSTLHAVCVRDSLKGRSFCIMWLKRHGVTFEGKNKSLPGPRSVRGRPISVWPLLLRLQNL